VVSSVGGGGGQRLAAQGGRTQVALAFFAQ
jgi:hypothetical protein